MAKKRSYTREEKLKVVSGQESATLSATTGDCGEARGTILLCFKMETAYLPWLFPVSVQSIICSPNRGVFIDLQMWRCPVLTQRLEKNTPDSPS